MGSGYSYVWEFHVSVEHQAAFEQHYGPEGSWVQLFRRSPGFRETLLLIDRSNSGRYLTVDRWQSEQAYLDFRGAFSAQYAGLDADCGKLTTAETFLGAFRE
jgi:heme-degrading monooxygenase HmoA